MTSGSGYSKARHDLSDRFMPQVKQIVGPYLLDKAPLEVDMREATDLITVVGADGFRCNVRVREPGYFDRYPDDFTLRSWIKSGAESELSKIERGHGDWMFYAHALTDSERDGFRRWRLLNLGAFRTHWVERRDARLRTGERSNDDGATKFRWFNIPSFPNDPSLVIAEGPSCPNCLALLKQDVGAKFIHSWCASAVGHYDSWRAFDGLTLKQTGAFLKR